jgi:hypothetical protein
VLRKGLAVASTLPYCDVQRMEFRLATHTGSGAGKLSQRLELGVLCLSMLRTGTVMLLSFSPRWGQVRVQA